MRNNLIFRKTIILNTIVWFCITAILPNLFIILAGFTEKNPESILTFNFTLENFFEAFSPLLIKIYLNSFMIGITTVLICILLGYPFAYYIYKENNKIIKYTLLFAVIIPFWTSSLIRTYAIILILKFNGVLNSLLLSIGIIESPLDMLYSSGAVVFGFVYTLIPFMIIPIYLSLRKINADYLEVAKDLGASRIQIFFRIILPLSWNGIATGSSVVLLSSFGMFYLSDLLGGSKNMLIGNIIRNQFLLNNHWNLGSAISIILYIVGSIWIIAQKEKYKPDFQFVK